VGFVSWIMPLNSPGGSTLQGTWDEICYAWYYLCTFDFTTQTDAAVVII